MSESKQYDIFISYRREGGKNFARILKPELEKRGFQDRVFLDFDELKDGKFDKRIMDAIDSAPIFIIILSDGCLDRCVNEDDWVRLEIVHALNTNKHIIPVVCDKSFKDFPANIPEFIKKGLGQHQFTQIDTDALLRASVNELVEYRIYPILKKSNSNVVNSNEFGAEIHIMTDANCRIMRFGQQISMAKVSEDNVIRLIKGNHFLEFVSVEYEDVKQTIRYSVPENEFSDFIEVKLHELVDEKKINELLNKKLLLCESENGKYGFRDEDGNFLIPCTWKFAREFEEGLAAVQNENNLWGYIDKTGKLVIPCQWEDAWGFSEGLAMVENENEKWGYIDKVGNVVITCKWEDASDFSEGLARVQDKNLNYGYIDMKGNLMVACKWEDAWDFREGLARVQDKNNRWGYIDKKGHVVIACKWCDAGDFVEGIASVQDENEKWGYIDKKANFVIPCKWNRIGSFSEGLAYVRDENWKAGFVDKRGELVIQCNWDFVGIFREGLAYVSDESGKYGFVNKVGDVVIPCKWKRVGSFAGGLATVYDENDECWIIDKSGTVLGRWNS